MSLDSNKHATQVNATTGIGSDLTCKICTVVRYTLKVLCTSYYCWDSSITSTGFMLEQDSLGWSSHVMHWVRRFTQHWHSSQVCSDIPTIFSFTIKPMVKIKNCSQPSAQLLSYNGSKEFFDYLCLLLLRVVRYSLIVFAWASSMMLWAVLLDITAWQKNRVAAANWNSSSFVGSSPWRYWKKYILWYSLLQRKFTLLLYIIYYFDLGYFQDK